MPGKRYMRIIIAVLVVAAALVWALVPKPSEVESEKVAYGPMMVTVDEEGKTNVAERFVISAPVAGFMRRVPLEAGDMVAKGQVVVEIEPLRSEALDPRSKASAEADVAAAASELRAAEENMRSRGADERFAASELERARALFERGHLSKSALERAESAAKQSEANLSAAAAAVKSARAKLEKASAVLEYPKDDGGRQMRAVAVRSPAAGRVLKLHRESEGAVAAGVPLVEVGDTASLEVRAEVLSTDAVNIKPGSSVYFERWGGEGVLEGRVRVVEPAAFTKVSSLGVEEQRVVVISDIVSGPEGWQSLGDGFRVEAKFVIWTAEKAVKVPVSALFRSGGRSAVFVVDEGRAKERAITIGHVNGISAEVLSGLSAGDEVIVHPDDALREGARVKPRKER